MTIERRAKYNWINPETYIDIQKLKTAIPLMQEDLREWMLSHPIETNTECAYATPEEVEEKVISVGEKVDHSKNRGVIYKELLTDTEEQQHYQDWRSIDFFYERRWNKEVFKRSWEVVSSCTGIKQIFINFIKPMGIITPHTDVSTWEKIEEDWGLEPYSLEGFSIIANLFSGMKDRKTKSVGMKVNGISKFPLAGELVCFDGRFGEHQMWNNTSEWRITAVIDIERSKFFNYESGADKEEYKRELDKPLNKIIIEENIYLEMEDLKRSDVDDYLQCKSIEEKVDLVRYKIKYLQDYDGERWYADRLEEDEVDTFIISHLNTIDKYYERLKKYYESL